MNLITEIGIGAAAVVVIGLGGLTAWDKYGPAKATGSASVAATVSPVLNRAPTAKVNIAAPIKVYRGDTKKNAKLPDDVQKDENKEVIAAVQEKASLRPQTVTTVIDSKTGEVSTFTKEDAYPWLAWEPRGEVGIAYGFKSTVRCASFQCDTDAKRVARLQFGYDLVRVKALTAGVVVTADSDRDVFAGARVRFQW